MDDLQEIEQHNWREIESLNQRGGRTLSFVDLVAAGTMSAEMIAHCWTAIAHGASFLTAARPGGAGKSTILANLLALLPPGERIVTWQPRRPSSAPSPICYLAHEIGPGHWYGYIWGQDVSRFLALPQAGVRVASCLHADTIEELREILQGPPLNTPTEAVDRIGLFLFVHILPRYQRRVAALYEATADRPRLAFSLEDDKIVRHGPSQLFGLLGTTEEEYEQRLAAVREIIAAGDCRFEHVRKQIIARYWAV